MKTTRLIFVDEHDSSKQNGIGTYRDILLPQLAELGIDIVLVSLNSDCFNLEVNRRCFGVEYSVPFVDSGNWRGTGDILWPLLHLYIPDRRGNVFMFNHSPCAENLQSAKKLYPQSKFVFTIHDQGWCAPLFGGPRLLAAIESGKRTESVSESTRNFVADYCDKERAIYQAVDKVICLSESTQKLLKEVYGVPDGKVSLIYNGFPCDRSGYVEKAKARYRLGLDTDDILLLFVARAAPHKGIRALLKALPEVRKRFPNVRCALLGNPHGFIDHWDIGAGVAANLILPGQLSGDELRLWYSAADIGVLSSYTEQCSYAALEMMNAGLLIVTSDGNGLCDMFTDGENAIVAHIGSVCDEDSYANELSAKIIQAIDMSKADGETLAQSARQLLGLRYSPDTMARRYATLLADNAF